MIFFSNPPRVLTLSVSPSQNALNLVYESGDNICFHFTLVCRGMSKTSTSVYIKQSGEETTMRITFFGNEKIVL